MDPIDRAPHCTQLPLLTVSGFGFLIRATSSWNHNWGQSLLIRLGLMDTETVRLILYDRSTGEVTLTVVDALPLAELEVLLELRHVFNVNRVPVSGAIIHLDENVSLRS